MKKVVSLILVLIMLMSLNAFALSSSDIAFSGKTMIGAGAGVETVLTKSGNTLTATMYLVGPMTDLSTVQVGLKTNTAKLTYDAENSGITDEFDELTSAWTKSSKGRIMSGYQYAGDQNADSTTTGAYISIAAGTKLKYAEYKYTMLEDINSTNYEEAIMVVDHAIIRTKLIAESNNAKSVGFPTYPEVFTINASGLDSYNLSINTPANGVATLSETTVAGGQSADLTVIPAVGYYISSVMAGEANLASSFDAYRGGTIKYAPTADTAITVTFAEINNVTEDVTTSTGMTGVDALTLPEVFRGKVNNEDVKDVSVAFGQIAPNAGKTVAGYGIYLTKADGSDVTTAAPSIGPKFAAKSISPENQFGIIFEQIKPGSYNAQTYIEYTDGSIVLGIKVPFTVAE